MSHKKGSSQIRVLIPSAWIESEEVVEEQERHGYVGIRCWCGASLTLWRTTTVGSVVHRYNCFGDSNIEMTNNVTATFGAKGCCIQSL